MTSLAEGIRIVRRLIEQGFNRGQLDVLAEVLDPAYIEHQSLADGVPPTADAVRQIILSLRTGFPDLHLAICQIDAVEDRVWMRIRATGTHQGEFIGNPPTGRSIDIDVVDLVRVRNGRITEHWGVPDNVALFEQLGLGP